MLLNGHHFLNIWCQSIKLHCACAFFLLKKKNREYCISYSVKGSIKITEAVVSDLSGLSISFPLASFHLFPCGPDNLISNLSSCRITKVSVSRPNMWYIKLKHVLCLNFKSLRINVAFLPSLFLFTQMNAYLPNNSDKTLIKKILIFYRIRKHILLFYILLLYIYIFNILSKSVSNVSKKTEKSYIKLQHTVCGINESACGSIDC